MTEWRGPVRGEAAGFVKLIAAGPFLKGKVLRHVVGMTAVGPAVGELPAEAALAMRSAFAGRLARTVHADPSAALATRVAASRFLVAHGGKTDRRAPQHPDEAELRALVASA